MSDCTEEERESVRRTLISPSKDQSLCADSICKVLDAANDAVGVSHRSLTSAWKSPLSLVDDASISQASSRRVPTWAIEVVLAAKHDAEDAVVLEHFVEMYKNQIQMSKREGWLVARAPVLDIIDRLAKLDEKLQTSWPRLSAAREAFSSQAGNSWKGGGKQDTNEHMDSGILQRIPSSDIEQSLPGNICQKPPSRAWKVWSSLNFETSKLGLCTLNALEFGIDVIHATSLSLELFAPEPPCTSPWLPILESWRAIRRLPLYKIPMHIFSGRRVGHPRFTVGYWQIRGIGAPLRMMCAYSAVDYEDKQYEAVKNSRGSFIAREWMKIDKPKLQERNPLIQLPYLVNHATDEVITEANAVYLHLGCLLGLNGVSDEEQLANEQIIFHVYNLFMEIRRLIFPNRERSDDDFYASLRQFFNKEVPAHYEQLEGWLALHGKDFFVSSVPCTADFSAWEIIDQLEEMACTYKLESPLTGHSQLKAFHIYFRKLPRLRSYFDSDAAKFCIVHGHLPHSR